MAGSVNKVILVGNVGKDPEIKTLNSGTMIANFSLATSETWRDKQTGEKKEKTEWHRIVVYNENIAKIVEKYVHKGSKLYVEGQLQTRKWTDQQGVEKYSTEVTLQAFHGSLTLLDGKRDDRGGGYDEETAERNARPQNNSSYDQSDYNAPPNNGGGNGGKRPTFDDEIPF